MNELTSSIFYQLFTLLNDNLFGGAVDFALVEGWMPLIVGGLAAAATVLLISLPFCAIYTFLKGAFAGFWARY